MLDDVWWCCMFDACLVSVFLAPDFTQGASVSRSREGRWGVRRGNLKSWVLQCYSATSIWCVLFIRVYHCLSWFDPTTTCTSRVNSPEMCLQKRRRFFFRCFQHVQVPQVQVIEVTKQLPKASGKKTQNQNLQTEDCLNFWTHPIVWKFSYRRLRRIVRNLSSCDNSWRISSTGFCTV